MEVQHPRRWREMLHVAESQSVSTLGDMDEGFVSTGFGLDMCKAKDSGVRP